MKRFFVLPEQARDGRIFFTREESFRIRNVLRLELGGKLIALDNTGMEWEAELTTLSKEGVVGTIRKETRHVVCHQPRLVLALALPAPAKMDWIVQKATELGVDEILPFICKRSVRMSPGKNRMDRWKKVAKEAAEQSRRIYIPQVKDIISFLEFSGLEEKDSLKILFWEKEKEHSLRSVLEKRDIRRVCSLWMAIGPEGGFEEEEVESARDAGVLSVGLGEEILRVETAGLAVLSIIQFFLGRLS